jgi:hypothetical protein
MEEFTFDQFRQMVKGRWASASRYERPGQNLFNSLEEYRPDLADKLRGTDIDPFYIPKDSDTSGKQTWSNQTRLNQAWQFIQDNW